MKIASINQYNKNNTNFKGTSSIEKYTDEIQKAIKESIQNSFADVLLETSGDVSIIRKFISKFPITEKIYKFFTDNSFIHKISDFFKKNTILNKIKKIRKSANNKVIDGIAAIIGKAANTNTSEKLVETLSHFKKPSARMADLASFAITFFYVNNTRKSKKIEEDRKMPLMVNNITVTAVSSTMAALIDKGSDVVLDRVKGSLCFEKGKNVVDNVLNTVPDITDKLNGHSIEDLTEDILRSKEFRIKVKDYAKRFEKAKSLTIFSFTVRFLITVLMVPVAGKIVKLIKENTINKDKHQNIENSHPEKKDKINKEETDDNTDDAKNKD